MKNILIILIMGSLVLFTSCNNTDTTSMAETESKSKQENIQTGSIEKETASEKIVNSTFEKKEIKVTFIELGSVKCIPCKMMQPVMEDIEKEYGDQVNIVFYDVWTEEGRPYAQKYKIRVIPTQVFLDKNEQEYYRHEGFFPKEELLKVLQKKGVK